MTARVRWRLTKPLRDRIVAGHPWVYDRAVDSKAPVEPGTLVTIVDDDGPVAVAIADPASPIRARVLDTPGAVIDDAWVRTRTAAAAARRVSDPLLVGCTGRRLVHGEGDWCPGIVIDQYADTGVVVFDGPAAAAFWRPRLAAVVEGLARGGVELAHVWVRGERGQRAAASAFLGDPPRAS